MENMTNMQTNHDIPKCNCCGNIAPWKLEPVLTGRHWIIGIILLIMGVVPGLIYLGTVVMIRSSKNNRAKICTKCNARNMFTFLY